MGAHDDEIHVRSIMTAFKLNRADALSLERTFKYYVELSY